MRIKLIIVTFLSILQFQIGWTQDVFEPGYVIKKNGDSLHGYFLFNGAPVRYFQLKFKKGVYSKPIILQPFDILRFQIGDQFYIKERIQIIEPSINPYTRTVDSFVHSMECFLRRVATGPQLDLYSYDGTKQRFFIRVKMQKNNSQGCTPLEQLVYWEPEDFEGNNIFKTINITGFKQFDSGMVKTKGRSIWYYGYRRRLNSFLKNPVDQRFEDLPYTENNLISAVQFINYGLTWEPPAEPREVCAKAFIAVGMAASQAKVIPTFDEKNGASFPWRMYPLFGIGMELQIPNDLPSFCGRMQIAWSQYKTGTGIMNYSPARANYFAFDIKAFGLSIAPTWKVDDEWGPFSFYMGPELLLEQLFVKVTRFGNDTNRPVQNTADERFNKMMLSLRCYGLLKAKNYAVSIQAPVAAAKVDLGDSFFMIGKKQWQICYSYNVLAPRENKRKTL